jgi:glucose/arabinose dehydrogenase
MQPSFGPDGALYFCQASNSAMGAPDKDWGFRKEHLLNACILRLDTTKVTPGKPIDAKTKDCGGSYDPSAPDAPLTIYATGVRLAYDLCWHSNGHLYAPTNGSSDGGNTPEGNGVPGLNEVPFAEDDWLHRIEKGKYYGHPNPVQNHFVMNGGNPDAGWTFGEVPQYPIGTKPDPDWQPAAWDMGPHISANGCVEYVGDAFNGKLNHKLLICRYNWGSDLIAIGFNEKGDVTSAQSGLTGMSNFESPLDVTEDLQSGNLYVSEYGAQKVTLLKPVAPGAPLNNAPEPTRTKLAKPYSDKG